jgi:hypothetical protein
MDYPEIKQPTQRNIIWYVGVEIRSGRQTEIIMGRKQQFCDYENA